MSPRVQTVLTSLRSKVVNIQFFLRKKMKFFIKNLIKYALNSTFEQTRAEDDLIRDCECTGDETTRLIKCALTR